MTPSPPPVDIFAVIQPPLPYSSPPTAAPPPDFILLSNSPRRRDLLSRAGYRFEVENNPFEETAILGESAIKRVKRLSLQKLQHYLESHPHPQLPVLAADTLLEFHGQPIEKPPTAEAAWQVYRQLAGHTHRVLTALTLWNPGRSSWQQTVEATKVRFIDWDEEIWGAYLATGEWHDAAGGYKIQETGERLVRWIRGSFSNVVGLPLERFYGMFRQCRNLAWQSPDQSR